jgi:hypothetical protein
MGSTRWWANAGARLVISRRELAIYVGVVLLLGSAMNALGKALAIAEFKHWWQVGTCYVGYVLPAALLVRHMRASDQVVFGLVAMVPLELAGYALGSSIAYPDNVLERVLGMRNFTLAMVVLVAPIPWIVNVVVERVKDAVRTAGELDPRAEMRVNEREARSPLVLLEEPGIEGVELD